MSDERERAELVWLLKSRELNPSCGCEQRGDKMFACSYHEGAADAWDEAWQAACREERKRITPFRPAEPKPDRPQQAAEAPRQSTLICKLCGSEHRKLPVSELAGNWGICEACDTILEKADKLCKEKAESRLLAAQELLREIVEGCTYDSILLVDAAKIERVRAFLSGQEGK